MRVVYTIIFALLFIVLVVLSVVLRTPKPITESVRINIGNAVVTAEVARSEYEKSKGLMGRKKLGKNDGMWFVYNKSAKYAFWMFNTYIPLDMIWVDENFTIVHIEQNVPPCTESIASACKSYRPSADARYILEVNAGFSEKHNITVGQKVILQ